MVKLILCFCLFWGSVAYAADGSADDKIHQKTLRNGLTVIVKEDHHAPAVVTMIFYRVGSAYEHNGTTGISHALEHMMFKGTLTYPGNALTKEFIRHGGMSNAGTTQDYTVYLEELSSNLVPLAFKLESDRMQHLLLKADDFKQEIQVVQEERRMRTDNAPQSTLYERLIAAMYLAGPYHNPPIGWSTDLRQMTINELREWYHQWYVPNNAIIVVVGDVKAAEVFDQAIQFFGDIKANALPVFKQYLEPPALGQRHIVVKRPAELPAIMLGYVVPSRVTDKQSWKPYALTMLNGILSAGNSSRLVSHWMHSRPIASQIWSDYDMYSLYESPFLLGGAPTGKHTIAELRKAMLEEIKTLQDTLVSASELEKVRNQLIAQKIYARDSMRAEASSMGLLASIGLPPNAVDTDLEKLKAVTPRQIQMVAREYLTSDRLTEAVLEPQAEQTT